MHWNFTAEIPADADLDSDDLENLRPPSPGWRSISTLYLTAIFIGAVGVVSPPGSERTFVLFAVPSADLVTTG